MKCHCGKKATVGVIRLLDENGPSVSIMCLKHAKEADDAWYMDILKCGFKVTYVDEKEPTKIEGYFTSTGI